MRVCVYESICVYVFVYLCVCALRVHRFVCALLGIYVSGCLTVYGHICISLDDVAVNFFGVTENDLQPLLLVNVSNSGSGSRCASVCMHNVRKWLLDALNFI